MHMKKLAVAVALACGTLTAGGAQAVVYDVDLFMSGASAVQANFVAQLPSLLVPASIVKACDNLTPSSCAGFFAVKGTFLPAASLPASLATLANRTVRITYRTRGGSVWGVDPVSRGAPIQWMDMDNPLPLNTPGACSTVAPGIFGETLHCPPTGNDNSDPMLNTSGRVSDLGVSDVEPKMFYGINLEYDISTMASRIALNSQDVGGLTSSPVFANSFGVPMTNVIPESMLLAKETLRGLLSSNSSLLHDWSKVPNAPPLQGDEIQ